MIIRRRWAFAAALVLARGVVTASAQTVIVREAAPGAQAELFIDDQPVAAVAVDRSGTATLAGDVRGRLGRDEVGMRVTVDTCNERRRVMLVPLGAQARPAEGACQRAAIPFVFSVGPSTTLVVEVGGDAPQVWIRQGPAPPSWIGQPFESGAHSSIWKAAPRGLVVSAGFGGANFSDAVNLACGDASPCVGQHLQPNYSATVSYWLKPSFGAEVSYFRPSSVKTNGSGSTFSFNSALDARVLAVNGKFGMQAGPLRVYGLGGVNRLSATSSTEQTLTAPNTAETFAFQAEGWGWQGGAGVELWATSRVGFFLESDLVRLKGDAIGNAEGAVSDTLLLATVGVRLAIGRSSWLATGR